MKLYLTLIISLLFSLGFMISCGEDENESETEQTVPGIGGGGGYQGDVTKYLGSYTTGCIATGEENMAGEIIITISETKQKSLLTLYGYEGEDPVCNEEGRISSEEETNEFAIIGTYKGGDIIRTTFSSLSMTFYDEDEVATLNAVNAYDHNDWVVGEAVVLTREQGIQKKIEDGDDLISTATVKLIGEELYFADYYSSEGTDNPDPEVDPNIVFMRVQ